MARRFDSRVPKAEPDAARPNGGGGEIWGLFFGGNPINGSADSDFILAQGASIMNGFGGDDLILGDIGFFRGTTDGNGSFANANDLDDALGNWSTDQNPLYADDSIPHMTVYVDPPGGSLEYFKLVIGAGQTITVDIDAAYRALGSAADTDTIVKLYNASLSLVEINDQSVPSTGGYGSLGLPDSFLLYTNPGAAAVFYIVIEEFGGDGSLEADDELLMNVSLTGHAVGTGGSQNADTIDGGEGDDHIFGAGGSDVLTGGTGADLMAGGTGNDTYNVDNADDLVGEVAGQGNDLVRVAVSYSLAESADVETLETSNAASGTPLDLAGSSIAQTIRGNNGVNLLRGEGGNDTLFGNGNQDFLIGGSGDDILHGGTGNDVYGVDSAGDSVIEASNEGDDSVTASVSYALSAGASVEAMSTADQSATTPLNLTGNEVAQSIFGNEGNNQLLGMGGVDQLTGYGGNDVLVGGGGIDYMRGGLGNDVYGIDDGDVILEVSGEGDDSLAADIGSYYLNDGASIETLSTANQAGTFAQNLTGNELAQSIAGSEGANVLNGNLGNDLLRGYGGADIFLFDTAPGASNHDVIADMAVGVDRIALQNAVFTGLVEGNLGANAFRVGAAAQDADDRIIWNAATNQLFYDADGNGAGAAVLFAIVNGSPNLQASDFIIV